MKLEGKKVLVTGSDGFIGSHLVERLLEENCQIKAFVYYNSFNSWGWIDYLATKTMEKSFGLPVGYSGHTLGIEIPNAAVALGAWTREKHFTLDRNMEGPDHKASLEPDELKKMVKAIRNVEKAIGNEIKEPSENEEETRNIVRRSPIATRDIKSGETISSGDITIKRPGNGILPEFIDMTVNRKAVKNISKDSLISWDDF